MMKLRPLLDWLLRITGRALARAGPEAPTSPPAAGASAVAPTNGRPPSTNAAGWDSPLELEVLQPSDPIFSNPIVIGWPNRGTKRTAATTDPPPATLGPGDRDEPLKH